MKIVVAGSTGLVGSSVSEKFAAYGHEVLGINSSVIDLRDYDAVESYIDSERPDLVIDSAAKVGGIQANNSFPVEFLLENLQIQINLMKACHRSDVRKFVFLGSSCIYPGHAQQPIKEESLLSGKLEPTNSAYAIAKIAGIELVNSYRKQYGLNWISLMPTNLYGPRDNFNLSSSHVLPALIRKFVEAKDLKSESVTLWGSGTPMREFLHVDDLSEAIYLTSLEYNSGIHLNVGTGQEISIKNLAELIAQIVKYEGRILWDVSKPDGVSRKVLDVSKLNSLGWVPKITLERGIAMTIEWYLENDRKGNVRK
jgi:GDP-L-fucose synthase